MNTLTRRIAFASFATVVALGGAARAFTDSDAEMKEAAAARNKLARVTVAKAAPPARTVWVPISAKKLDGFAPVLPARPEAAEALARAELAVAVRR